MLAMGNEYQHSSQTYLDRKVSKASKCLLCSPIEKKHVIEKLAGKVGTIQSDIGIKTTRTEAKSLACTFYYNYDLSR